MNVNKRDRRDHLGAERGAGQRTPRSGGRTAAERTTRTPAMTPVAARGSRIRDARARGAREFPVEGTAALRAEPIEMPRHDRADRARDDARRAHPAGTGRVPAPRLEVAPPPPVAGPRAPFVALILAVVVGGVLGILLVNTKINENAIRLDRMQKQQAALDLQQQQLNEQIADAQAPGNLVARARALGLVEPGPPAFIRLPDGRVIGVPQPAGGQPAITSQQGAGG